MSSYLDQLKAKMASTGNNTPVEASGPSVEAIKPKANIETTNGHDALKRAENPLIKDLIKIEEKPKDKQFYLSQTIIKAVTNNRGEYKEVCPQAIYQKYILKKHWEGTLSMLEGQFAETLCLGGGAKGQAVYDLPRHKKNGEKLTAQLNIEEQARRFPIWCNEKGITVYPGVNTQFPIIKEFEKGRYLRTEIDIFPSPFLIDNQYKLSVIDLKFTADINSRFGPKDSMEENSIASGGWGAPEFMDFCQADLTYWLLEDFDMELNCKHNPEWEPVYQSIFGSDSIRQMIKNEDIMFIYFIIGYKKQPLHEQKLFVHREYRDPNSSKGSDNYRRRELMERIRKTYAQLNEWHLKKWPVRPGSLCDKCPVNKVNGGECEAAPKIKAV